MPQNTENQTIRIATIADLDAITTVAVDTLHEDPVNPYRFPHWQKFPEDYAKVTRMRYEAWLKDLGNVAVVCEVSEDGHSAEKKIVAFSIWELPLPQQERARQEQAATDGSAGPTRADILAAAERVGNIARINAVSEEMGRAKKEYFDTPFEDSHMYLSILGCHPDYQRRGIGKQLVSWGLEKAKREGLTLTVFGSPMGAYLYRKVGFKEISRCRVQVDGDEKPIESLVMVLENKDLF